MIYKYLFPKILTYSEVKFINNSIKKIYRYKGTAIYFREWFALLDCTNTNDPGLASRTSFIDQRYED